MRIKIAGALELEINVVPWGKGNIKGKIVCGITVNKKRVVRVLPVQQIGLARRFVVKSSFAMKRIINA